MEDLEDQITVYNLVPSSSKNELTIVKKSTNDGVYLTTEFEIIKLKNGSANTVLPFTDNRIIRNIVCLKISDILSAVPDGNWFKIYGFLFGKVLCYGSLLLKQIFTLPSGKSCLLFVMNDGTQQIIAKYYSLQERNQTNQSNNQWLTNEKTKLTRMHSTGININGKYVAPKTNECQKILQTISNMHKMIANNIATQSVDYQLGPMSEKALILAHPFKTSTNETQLHIYDISLNDNIENVWNKSLRKIYKNEYHKIIKK